MFSRSTHLQRVSESPFFTELDGFPLDLTAGFCAVPAGCRVQGWLPVSAVASDVAVNVAQCSPRGGMTASAGKILPLILTLQGVFLRNLQTVSPVAARPCSPARWARMSLLLLGLIHVGFPGLPVVSVCIS